MNFFHYGEVLTLGGIDKDKRQPITLKESQGVLSMWLRKPIPITQLNCKPLITKKRSELLEFVEFVFAWRKRRAELKKKSAELAGLAQWFDLSRRQDAPAWPRE